LKALKLLDELRELVVEAEVEAYDLLKESDYLRYARVYLL